MKASKTIISATIVTAIVLHAVIPEHQALFSGSQNRDPSDLEPEASPNLPGAALDQIVEFRGMSGMPPADWGWQDSDDEDGWDWGFQSAPVGADAGETKQPRT